MISEGYTTEKRGSIILKDKAVMADPSFVANKLKDKYVVENVKPGRYNCYVLISGNFDNGVSYLVAVHEDLGDISFDPSNLDTEFCCVDVDSSLCGIFDHDYFETYSKDNYWYDTIYQSNDDYYCSHENNDEPYTGFFGDPVYKHDYDDDEEFAHYEITDESENRPAKAVVSDTYLFGDEDAFSYKCDVHIHRDDKGLADILCINYEN